jgi:hypothetical protein
MKSRDTAVLDGCEHRRANGNLSARIALAFRVAHARGETTSLRA